MSHRPADTDLIHDALDDISETRPLQPELVEVLDLMEIPHTGGRARASRHDWRRVDAIAARLAEARASAVPAPRQAV